jgi:DNA-directed RNA polymerase specialized sigma24 family protein
MNKTIGLPARWNLSQKAFDRFLENLDPDRDSAGERYEALRRNLIHLFTWRGCDRPEDHADETINRVIRKIDEGEEIRDLIGYAHGVARHVLLEVFKSRRREGQALEQLPAPVTQMEAADDSEQGVTCLRRCINRLPQESRQLIIQYYQGDKKAKIEQRKLLADSLRITVNALRYRAFDLRQRLEGCITRCMEQS